MSKSSNLRKPEEKLIKKKLKVKPGKVQISCEDCDFHTVCRKKYKKHMFEKHEQNLCTECGMAFDNFGVFFLHLEMHESAFVCDICSTAFRTLRILNNHKRMDHNIEVGKKEVCPKCGAFVNNIQNHLRNVHNEVKPILQCSECSYSTQDKHNLKNHFKV